MPNLTKSPTATRRTAPGVKRRLRQLLGQARPALREGAQRRPRNLDDADGVVSSHELGSVLGLLDWYGFDETLISGQIFQTWVMETPPGLLADSVDHSLSPSFSNENF